MASRQTNRKIQTAFRGVRRRLIDRLNALLAMIRSDKPLVNDLEVRVIGLRRTGNHAIINWLYHQFEGRRCFLNNVFPGTNPFLTYQERSTVRQFQVDFYRDFSITRERLGFFSRKEALIYSFEDRPLADIHCPAFVKNRLRWVGKSAARKDLILLRDPYNLFASRLNHPAIAANPVYGSETSETIVNIRNLWKEYAREFLGETSVLGGQVIPVNFNQWVGDETYRRGLIEKMGRKLLNDGVVHEVLPIGGGSSFDGGPCAGDAARMAVFARWQAEKDNPAFREFVDDSELRELSRKIFGETPGLP